MEDNSPDIFDLEAWAFTNNRALLDVTRYLSDSSKAYELLLMAWVKAGSPEIH